MDIEQLKRELREEIEASTAKGNWYGASNLEGPANYAYGRASYAKELLIKLELLELPRL